MKYTSNNFSANITRVCYLPDENNSVKHILDKLDEKNIEIYPNDAIIILSPHSQTPEYFLSVCGNGAGVTNVGSDKSSCDVFRSFAKFKHITNRARTQSYSVSTIDTIDDDIIEFFPGMTFKSEDSKNNFVPVFNNIKKGLSRCDQSLLHMMAKYAIGYDKAKSKGNCGITRNCRNIYTIDCDESVSYATLVDIINGTYRFRSILRDDIHITSGIERIIDLVKRIHALTGALPQIVYNKATSHFQIQYLMKDPVYVTEDLAVATFKSEAASKRDKSFQETYTKSWKSVFDRSFNLLKKDGEVMDLYDIVYKRFGVANNERIIFAMLSYKGDVEYVDLIGAHDFITERYYNANLKKVAAKEYTKTHKLGINMFNIARNSKLLLNTPEYIYYGNAHKIVGYINEGNYKFVDTNYNYCANKSLAIGTDDSIVFNTIHRDDVLRREQIITDDGGQYKTDLFNLMDIKAWDYAEKYSIDTRFIVFMGSLETAEQLFDEDIDDKYNAFISSHSFMFKKNVPIDECKAAADFKARLRLPDYNAEESDDILYEKAIELNEEESQNRLKHLQDQQDTVPLSIEDICEKYLGESYLERRYKLVRKIYEDSLNFKTMSRHKFDYVSGLSVFSKAILHNAEFCNVCFMYNQSIDVSYEGDQMINDVDHLISYIFDDIVYNVYHGTLPGTSHHDAYKHAFDLRATILSTDQKVFLKYQARNVSKTKGVINGASAITLLSGSTKLNVIHNMFKLLPAYIYKEEKVYEHSDIAKKVSESKKIKAAWLNELEDCFDPSRASSLRSICALYKPVTYSNSNDAGKGIKYITYRELKDSGSAYFRKKNKHIAEFCLETASHFRVSGDPYGNINKYIASLEYFTNIVKNLQEEGDWCIDIKDETVEPSLEKDIADSGLDTKLNNQYIVKDRTLILSQIKTYRYFVKIYSHIKATLEAVDMPSEDDHILRLQSATHELYDTLETFLHDLYSVLTSYNNVDSLRTCKNIDNATPFVDVEKAISNMIYHIELYYDMVDFFGEEYKWDDDWEPEETYNQPEKVPRVV